MGLLMRKDELLQAIKSVRVNGSAGQFRFRPESQGPIVNVYICRVEKRSDGSYYNAILKTIPSVDDLSF